MADTNTTPATARARIAAIHKAARELALQTGGDPAECAFELVCAAILVIHEARPAKLPADMIAGIAEGAAQTVEHWFPEELKKHRCRHG